MTRAMTRVRGMVMFAATLLVLLAGTALAGVAPPSDLQQRAGFDQHVGQRLPMDLDLRGNTLAGIGHDRPLLLAFGYYHCPNLCDLVLQGMARAISVMKLQPGRDIEVVFVSIDPRETSGDAADAAAMLHGMFPRAGLEHWHLLTADAPAISALTHAAGFRYFFDARINQFAHPAGWVVATGQGVVAQYFPGVTYEPQALRLALVDGSRGKLGTVVDRFVLLCCGYDPATGRYSLLIGRISAVLGSAFVLVMLIAWWRLARRRP
ncbi:SCO family protein [Pinirhizobacter sp.]|jgi:protein SCO1/2|uniref:SCO family protein n=1 Tax=Pinirhizobacter sp. TaxID=2950432 RepID=UPI002F3F3CA4